MNSGNKVTLLLLLVILGVVWRVNCIKTFERPLDFNTYRQQQSYKIKIVHYAYKHNAAMNVSSMPVRNLMINPTDDWQAKAIWIGDNYNTTGSVQKEAKFTFHCTYKF